MLQAIFANKAGKSIESKEVHWRELFTASEDSLTSTIFENLLLLPNKFLWQILIDACYNKNIITPSTIISKKFWPRWKTSNEGRISVEPDLFLETLDFNLIVEAKRHDYNQQNSKQWEEECKAYLTEYPDEKKPVYLFAVGGIADEGQQQIVIGGITVKIIKCRWSSILNETKRLRKQMQGLLEKDFYSESIVNILDNLILGFRIHGYSTGEWFETTKVRGLDIDNLSSFKLNANPFTLYQPAMILPTNYKINSSSLINLSQNKYA